MSTREQFEAWARRTHTRPGTHFNRARNGVYLDNRVAAKWAAWNAATACAQLNAAMDPEQDAQDAARWREAIRYVGADRSPALMCTYFALRGINPVPGTDVFRGGIAGHFTDAIDAARGAK